MKIFNWIGGSFFRTLGRFLFYIAMGSLLAFLFGDKFNFFAENVHASTNNTDYISNFDVPMKAVVQQTANSSGEKSLSTGYIGDALFPTGSSAMSEYVVNRSYLYTPNTFSFGNGSEYWLEVRTEQNLANHLYNYQMLICLNKGLSSDIISRSIGLVTYDNYYFPQYDYKNQTYYSYDEMVAPYISLGSTWKTCSVYAGYGSYKNNTSGIGLHLTSTGSLTGVKVAIMGYKIVDLGYYEGKLKQDIEDIINTNMSGVATKSDINSVNRKIEETNEAISDVNDSINNSNTNGANSDASGFFDNFQSNDHGLTGIITTPLNLINSIASATCSPLSLPLPFVNENLELPCMSSIYSQYFGTFYTIYQTITFGIVAYWVCVRIFYKVQDFKNPSNSEVDVLEL